MMLITAVLLVASVILVTGCSNGTETHEKNLSGNAMVEGLKGRLFVFHAGSLASPFEKLEKIFEKRYPAVDVQREASGSRIAVKKVTELGRRCGVVASADYTVIESLMFPKYADWCVKFATNQMVIAYTDRSKYKGQITKENWYRILQKEDVEWGHSNPDADPCGYRTVLVCQLAEMYCKIDGLAAELQRSCPKKNIRPKSVELIVLLKQGELDYAFEYRSVAVQHKLKFLELPDELNLGAEAHKEFYNKAEIKLSDGKTKKGMPIVYGVTIPTDAENRVAAVEFVKLLLSAEGQAIMQQNGQPPIKPAIASDTTKVPDTLRRHTK